MTPDAAAALLRQIAFKQITVKIQKNKTQDAKIKIPKNHSRVPTQGYIYKIKHKIKNIYLSMG